MRCPDCNKFVPFEEEEPEVENIEVNEDGDVTASVRIMNSCAECGTELTEATLELEADHAEECEDHQGKGHELEIEDTGSERTSRSGYYDKRTGAFVPKGGRYAKTFYGAEVSYAITCSCGGLKIDGTFSDDVQASGMDEMV